MKALLALLLITPVQATCVTSEEQETIRKVLHHSLDVALDHYVQRQFENWMADPVGQPNRAAVGVRKALRAYREASKSIDTSNYQKLCEP